MNVFLDDIRSPQETLRHTTAHHSKGISSTLKQESDYIWVTTYAQAINLLETGKVKNISLDHDLGEAKTGYDVICWIEQKVEAGTLPCPNIYCHSWNPVGRSRILQVIQRIERLKQERV